MPILTLGRCAHVEIVDQAKALAALPSIDTARGGREAARATGTDDAAVSARSRRYAIRCPNSAGWPA
jgi:hypothetical protein